MIKKLLTRAVSVLPQATQSRIRGRYWQIKSRILYRSLCSLLHLEHTLDSGLTIQVASKSEWWIYNDIFVNGEYDVPIDASMQGSSEKSFVVLDLGANVGYFAFRLLDRIRKQHLDNIQPDITMIEGSPETFAKMKMRIQSQRLAPATVRTVHGLVGDRSGSALIREPAVHVKSGIANIPAGSGVSVAFLDVDTLMRDKAGIELLSATSRVQS